MRELQAERARIRGRTAPWDKRGMSYISPSFREILYRVWRCGGGQTSYRFKPLESIWYQEESTSALSWEIVRETIQTTAYTKGNMLIGYYTNDTNKNDL